MVGRFRLALFNKPNSSTNARTNDLTGRGVTHCLSELAGGCTGPNLSSFTLLA